MWDTFPPECFSHKAFLSIGFQHIFTVFECFWLSKQSFFRRPWVWTRSSSPAMSALPPRWHDFAAFCSCIDHVFRIEIEWNWNDLVYPCLFVYLFLQTKVQPECMHMYAELMELIHFETFRLIFPNMDFFRLRLVIELHLHVRECRRPQAWTSGPWHAVRSWGQVS